MEQISVEARDDALWIHLTGDLDQSEILQLKAPFDEAVQGASGDVVVDLGGVTFLGTLGIGLFLATHRRLQREGRTLRLAEVPDAIEDTLDLMNITDLIDRV